MTLLASSLTPFGHFRSREKVLTIQADIQIPWHVRWQLLDLAAFFKKFLDEIVHRLPSD